MFTTYDLLQAEAFGFNASILTLPAFLGSGAFRLADSNPRDPDAPDVERWEDDGGPPSPEED